MNSSTLLRYLKTSLVATSIKRILYGRFARMAFETKGMLHPRVYRKIYETTLKAPDLDTVEIGGAGGSGSIAFAWAKIDSNKRSAHIVVEKMEGGSRSRYGDYDDNMANFQRHLIAFEAAPPVKIFPHFLTTTNAIDLIKLIETDRIAGFMSDADGRIDRDFAILLPITHHNGFIIIDDYHPTRSWKHAMTYRLLNHFAKCGLFEFDKVIKNTVFGRPGPAAGCNTVDPAKCAEIIESIRVDFDLASDSEAVLMYFQ